MPKRRRTSDSDVSATETPSYDTVFIDTSLGTHLVTFVSSTDTVSDFKKKLVLEHMRCFPETGEVEIHSLKVKRGENFYYLPDALFVTSVFRRVEGDRFLAADCSTTSTCYLNRRSSGPGQSDAVEIDVRSKICDVDGAPTPLMPLENGATGKTVVSEMTDGFNVENSLKEVAVFQSNCSLNSTESRQKKKKRKLSRNEDVSQRSNLDEIVNGSHMSPVERADFGKTMVNSVKVGENAIGYAQHEKLINILSELASVRNDQPPNGVAFEGTTDDIKKKDTSPESVFPNDSVAGKSHDKYSSSIPTDHPEGVALEELNLSAGLIENTGKPHDTKSEGSKKGKKAKKTHVKMQDLSDLAVENRKAESAEGSKVENIVDSPLLLDCDEREENVALENVIDENDMSRKSGNELVPNDQADRSKEFDVLEINNSVALDDVNVDGNKKRNKPGEEDQDTSNLEQEPATCENSEGTRAPTATAEKFIEKPQIILTAPDSKLESGEPDSVPQKFENEHDKNDLAEHSAAVIESNISAIVVDTSARMHEGVSHGKKRKKSKKKGVGMCAPATAKESIDNFQLLFASDGSKEGIVLGSGIPDSVTQKSENEPGKDVPVEPEITRESNHPAGVVDTSDQMQDAKPGGKKRKKSKKKGARIQDASDVEDETRGGEFIEPCPKPCNIQEKEDGKQRSLGPNLEGMHAPATTEKKIENSEIILASDGKKVDTALESQKAESLNKKSETELDKIVPTEQLEGIREPDPSARVVDTHERMQDAKSDGKKRKKSKKKGPRIQDALCVKDETRNGESNEPCAEAGNTKEKEDAGRPSLVHNKEVVLRSHSKTSDPIDAELSQKAAGSLPNLSQKNIVGEEKISSSTRERKGAASLAYEKLPSANGIDSNIVVSVTEQTLEDVATEKKGLGISDTAFPVAVEENPVLAHYQIEVRKESPRNRDKKGKKKRKKTEVTASDVQENFSIKDKIISGEMPLTEQDLTSSLKKAHAASSQVTPDKREENVGTEHDSTAQNIDFRQYFVHDQNQQRGTSNADVNESSKANGEMKTRKNVKDKAPSTELQRSLRSSNHQESDMESRFRGDGGREDNNPILKSGENAAIQKHNEILPMSSFTGEKNRSLPKSNTERSETLSENREDKKVMKTPRAKSLLGKSNSSPVNSVNNKMTSMKAPQNKSILAKSGAKYQDNGRGSSIKKISMKTPQKKSLLKRSGSIFQGNSDDDSGDDNGSVHPVATPRTPSDSSSQSEDSGGESELSQKSEGSHDGKGKSAGGLGTSKLDLSEEFSIKAILRSSKQFKKAKLHASQSEPELDESLLDSQPYP